MIEPTMLLRLLLASALASILGGQSAGAAAAPASEPAVCNTLVVAPPPYSGWSRAATAASAAGADVTIPIGQRIEVKLAVVPGTTPAPHYGATLKLRVPAAGVYHLALGSKAWVDVLAQGVALKPEAFGQGPDCTGIRKFVAFHLAAGDVTIRIGDSATPTIQLLVAPV